VIGNAAVPNVDLIITGASDLFENGTETVLLVSSATPIVQGTDVDTNNDGAADVSLGTIVDGVGLVDTGYPATDFIYYSQPIVGPDGSNFPAGVQRCEDCTGPLTRLMCFTMTGCAGPAASRTAAAWTFPRRTAPLRAARRRAPARRAAPWSVRSRSRLAASSTAPAPISRRPTA
jgi:hypothetical protein